MPEGRGSLDDLKQAVESHDSQGMEKALESALGAGARAGDIRSALLRGLDNVRHRLMSNESSIPELLLSLDAVIAGLEKVSSTVNDGRSAGGETPLVIGVVEGDPHDLGKNIIAGIYRSSGYRVFDLGREVPGEDFVNAVEDCRAGVLALSAMMSTTMVEMRDIIQEVRERSPDTVIMVGGAPLDETLARSFGADGYAETALDVLEETEAAIRRSLEGQR